MGHRILHGIAIAGIGIKQLSDKIFCVLGYDCYVIIECELTGEDLLEQLALICSIEWELAVQHSVENHPRTPGVDFGPIVGFVFKDLGRCIIW
jgi:hypothetical protein